MLEGTVAWPEEFVARYRREGWWEDIGIFEILERAARRSPDKAAVVTRDRRISDAELQRDASLLAARLRGLGIEARDRVLVLMRRAVAQLSALRLPVLRALAQSVREAAALSVDLDRELAAVQGWAPGLRRATRR